jgi:hypothetical protein
VEFGIPHAVATPAGVLTFNDYASSDYFRLTSIENADMPALRVPIEARPQRDGAFVFDGYRGAMTEVFHGEIVCSSLTNRATKEDELRAKLNALLRGDGTWTWTPSGKAGRQRTVRLADSLLIRNADAIRKEFQFALASGDPYAYSQTQTETATSLLSLVSALGTWSLASTGTTAGWRLATTGTTPSWTLGTGGSSGTATVTNNGNAPSFATVRIYGAIAAATFANTTTGEVLDLSNLDLAAGDYLEIDMRAETLYLNGDPSRSLLSALSVAGSMFWALQPGANSVRLQAASYDANAYAAVIYRDAFYG